MAANPEKVGLLRDAGQPEGPQLAWASDKVAWPFFFAHPSSKMDMKFPAIRIGTRPKSL